MIKRQLPIVIVIVVGLVYMTWDKSMTTKDNNVKVQQNIKKFINNK